MKEKYIEQIYAGWLAKIIGIRLGAPIEGWTYEKIRELYGEPDGYLIDYQDFAADDDSNGPLFFLRALEDSRSGYSIQAQDVAEALLNYAPYEHGFFWWGGYGTATEHTAYLNLRNSIPAPLSGSIAQNGSTMAEQIGGQIFIDTWGLVTPGNPDLAAQYAQKAASVTHGGNGIYGGIFIAVCISYAFVENEIEKIIEKGLSYIPEDCEYARAVRAIKWFYHAHPGDWRACFQYVHDNWGYSKYPGNCHIIPNAAVIILALLYGEGNFSDTLNICNMCGWDTDCNVGNLATIMGVRGGLAAIDYQKWRRPINDFLACSSVIGSLNIQDIPYGALYITKLAYAVAGEEMPEPWKHIADGRIDSCHFEFPGSTHAIRVRKERPGSTHIENTDETAFDGSRSLKIVGNHAGTGEHIYVYKKTYYCPDDFHDSRYDPGFSPIVYPGQTIHGSVFIPEYGCNTQVCLYAKEQNTGEILLGESVNPEKGKWIEMGWKIPDMEGGLIAEIGFCFCIKEENSWDGSFVGMIDDLYTEGRADYTILFEEEEEEVWPGLHREVRQFTRLKGMLYLEGGQMHLSCADYAEAYTGRYDWRDYTAAFTCTPLNTGTHMQNVRVQGAVRSYAAGFLPGGKFAILKNENGYRVLTETEYQWEPGKEYVISIKVSGNRIEASVQDGVSLTAVDEEHPYLTGSIGVSASKGGHTKYRKIEVKTS
ncbi:ADP-ribosylglycohydrolase family protein [Faecalicatena orotica]|uniref:ADP-ribosylglycohydrolase n=1 Tax=Faecalicatena orotica TaxID=1544 RepID=A0A2Y9BA06_9FIRM|nr:ADP-ribosylglycohydrolase family protein [Faecalicatena orotica]PWJ31228.1 ADP-ribosylglycohydrolase [Faecalicatena orotica]SSA54434.1 ADP-ribosylglycohydrolase [Faecalicatena orotica]